MRKLLLLQSICFWSAIAIAQQPTISVSAKPGRIFIEKGEQNQYINFDFLVSHSSADTINLSRIEIQVLDKNHTLLQKKFLDNNGTAPSIQLIPDRNFNGVSSKLIFNPFADFSLSLPLYELRYEFVFTDTKDQETKITRSVFPQVYHQKQSYTFPLKGRVLVYDAHDHNAHHRRFNYEFAPIKELGLQSNFMRYAYDFILVDKNNREFKGSGKDEEYIGYGSPVYAVGAGKVIYVASTHPDNKQFNVPGLVKNPLELYGNCIAILHADSAISIYGHLQQNSIPFKAGDKINAGQAIGRIGVSGSSFLPHLHFEMRTSLRHDAEGLPSYFSNIYLLEGSKATKLKSGLAETGAIIESR